MSKIKNKVIESFKWKKNSKYCAKRLGINIEEYKKLKKQVIIERRNQSNDTVIDQKYDIDKGSATITAKSTNERCHCLISKSTLNDARAQFRIDKRLNSCCTFVLISFAAVLLPLHTSSNGTLSALRTR